MILCYAIALIVSTLGRSVVSRQVPRGLGYAFPLNVIQSKTLIKFLLTVPGKWGEWEPWSVCSATCGTGTKIRTRECDRPAPQYGGVCPGNGQEEEACVIRPCPTSESIMQKRVTIAKQKMFHQNQIHARSLYPTVVLELSLTHRLPDRKIHQFLDLKGCH